MVRQVRSLSIFVVMKRVPFEPEKAFSEHVVERQVTEKNLQISSIEAIDFGVCLIFMYCNIAFERIIERQEAHAD